MVNDNSDNSDPREIALRYNAILDATGDGVWDWDLKTNKVYYSNQWKKMLGYESSEISDDISEWKKRIHPDDASACYAEINNHINGLSGSCSLFFRILHKNGKYLSVWGRCMGLKDADKKIYRMIGILQDITLEKKLKTELEIKAKILEDLNQQLFTLSVVDDLTKLYNRRKFREDLEKEIERSQRHNVSLCMSFIDLDFFKKINDTYGHLCGDIVLKNFSNLLREQIRANDLVYRIGGEEFAILLPHTNINAGVIFVERLRTACHETI
ncbi:MAG: diguanylate cyclase, partial [Gammaproteobacteria bacterium]